MDIRYQETTAVTLRGHTGVPHLQAEKQEITSSATVSDDPMLLLAQQTSVRPFQSRCAGGPDP